MKKILFASVLLVALGIGVFAIINAKSRPQGKVQAVSTLVEPKANTDAPKISNKVLPDVELDPQVMGEFEETQPEDDVNVPRLDTTSEESIFASLNQMKNSLSAEDKAKFEKAALQIMVNALENNPDKVKFMIDPRTLSPDEVKDFQERTKSMVLNLARQYQGKSAQDIIKHAETNIADQTNPLEKLHKMADDARNERENYENE